MELAADLGDQQLARRDGARIAAGQALQGEAVALVRWPNHEWLKIRNG
jgi:hypothetical protein